MGNRCFPTKIEAVVDIIEQSELVRALYNVQMVGSLNGVSQTEVDNNTNLRKSMRIYLHSFFLLHELKFQDDEFLT